MAVIKVRTAFILLLAFGALATALVLLVSKPRLRKQATGEQIIPLVVVDGKAFFVCTGALDGIGSSTQLYESLDGVLIGFSQVGELTWSVAFVNIARIDALRNQQERRKIVSIPVFLNHFYITLDHATYAAIQRNEYLRRDFAVTEERTTIRKDRSYTGLYFYGTNTYFEFFDADLETRRQVGDSAIAFGVDQSGASLKLADSLGTIPITITRQLETRDLPWFYMTVPRGFSLDSAIGTWIMEYHPRFLPEWHPEAGGAGGITRKEVLRRYKTVLKRGSAETSFSDVTGITMAADKQVAGQMTELCKVFGYGARMDAEKTILQGPDFELRLVPATESVHGIRQVSLRVSRKSADNAELRFGSKSVLTFHSDGTASWSF